MAKNIQNITNAMYLEEKVNKCGSRMWKSIGLSIFSIYVSVATVLSTVPGLNSGEYKGYLDWFKLEPIKSKIYFGGLATSLAGLGFAGYSSKKEEEYLHLAKEGDN
tara:strand:+ start:20848 stop:21165 length:318 start_codon:yes stop_codon:yes gene_type:complete